MQRRLRLSELRSVRRRTLTTDLTNRIGYRSIRISDSGHGDSLPLRQLLLRQLLLLKMSHLEHALAPGFAKHKELSDETRHSH